MKEFLMAISDFLNQPTPDWLGGNILSQPVPYWVDILIINGICPLLFITGMIMITTTFEKSSGKKVIQKGTK